MDDNAEWIKTGDEPVDTQVEETTGAIDDSIGTEDLSCWCLAAISGSGWFGNDDIVNVEVNDSVDTVGETSVDLIGGEINLGGNISVGAENKILFEATEGTEVEDSETIDWWDIADALSNAEDNLGWFKMRDELADIQVVATTGATDDSVTTEDLICSHILDGMVGIDSICIGFNDSAGTANENWVDSTGAEILDLESNNSVGSEDELLSVATEEIDSETMHRLGIADTELFNADENVGWIKSRDESVDTQVADIIGETDDATETEDLSHVGNTLDDIDSIDKADNSVVNDTVGTGDDSPADSTCEDLVGIGGNFSICAEDKVLSEATEDNEETASETMSEFDTVCTGLFNTDDKVDWTEIGNESADKQVAETTGATDDSTGTKSAFSDNNLDGMVDNDSTGKVDDSISVRVGDFVITGSRNSVDSTGEETVDIAGNTSTAADCKESFERTDDNPLDKRAFESTEEVGDSVSTGIWVDT